MDDQVGDADQYSDDDLDALPDNAFHQLEEHAFQSTQRPAAQGRAQLPAIRPSYIPNATSFVGSFGRVASAANEARNERRNGPHFPSSDYGDLDDEMLDGEIHDANEQPNAPFPIVSNQKTWQAPGESTQRETWRQQRYSGPQSNVLSAAPEINGHTTVHPERNAVLPGAVSNLPYAGRPPVIQEAVETASDGALQAEIARLLREKEELKKQMTIIQDSAYSKAGEISIVRANAVKLEKEYENRTKALEQKHRDEVSRQREELEMTRAKLEKLTTERTFLENEVAEGERRARKLQKDLKENEKLAETRSHDQGNRATTPKKARISMGDGFNKSEMQPFSPSKLAHRTKPDTPRAGSKRKRKGQEESPAKQTLELDEEMQILADDHDMTMEGDGKGHAGKALLAQRRRDQDFEFIQSFLDHRFMASKERTIETLARYQYPSDPKKAMSTMLLDQLSPGHIQPNTPNLDATVALSVIALWARCIQEKYHDPVHLYLDQIKFILIVKSLRTAPHITDNLMALLQETADIIIIPRCQKKAPRDDRAEISSTDCLQVMCLMATQLSISLDESTRFWRTMRFDFVMMLLSYINPLNELHLMIRILHTSILPNSFAMIIPPNDGKQDATEARVIDNLSRLLVEPPRPNQSELPLTPVELAELRLAIVGLIEDMAANDYAAMAICRHRLLLGRLVRLMNDSLSNAYDHTAAHPYLIELVNSATRLLYSFLNNYAQHISMQEKLSVIPGGEKKFLIVLTRLAFSEGIYLEEGIEDDVVDLAHRMLEERVSPEEAEGLEQVMSTAPSTRAPTTRRESRGLADDEEAVAAGAAGATATTAIEI